MTKEQERNTINQQIEEFFRSGKTIRVLEQRSTRDVIETMKNTEEFKRWNRRDNINEN